MFIINALGMHSFRCTFLKQIDFHRENDEHFPNSAGSLSDDKESKGYFGLLIRLMVGILCNLALSHIQVLFWKSCNTGKCI